MRLFYTVDFFFQLHMLYFSLFNFVLLSYLRFFFSLLFLPHFAPHFLPACFFCTIQTRFERWITRTANLSKTKVTLFLHLTHFLITPKKCILDSFQKFPKSWIFHWRKMNMRFRQSLNYLHLLLQWRIWWILIHLGTLSIQVACPLKVSKSVWKVYIIVLYHFSPSYLDRDGTSPARDYPKPWLDFLYSEGCVELID